MKISYGFVFYFEIFMIVLTISLILLYFQPIRRLIFGLADKYKIGEGPIYNTIFWIIFAVIAIILIDSVLTYWAIRQTLEIGTSLTYFRLQGHARGQLRHHQSQPAR